MADPITPAKLRELATAFEDASDHGGMLNLVAGYAIGAETMVALRAAADEIERLKVALAEAAIPLEALRMVHGFDSSLISPKMVSEIGKACDAIRAALVPSDPAQISSESKL